MAERSLSLTSCAYAGAMLCCHTADPDVTATWQCALVLPNTKDAAAHKARPELLRLRGGTPTCVVRHKPITAHASPLGVCQPINRHGPTLWQLERKAEGPRRAISFSSRSLRLL